MRKTLIRLTEEDLHRIVKESVNRILREVKWTDSKGVVHSAHGYYGDDEASKEKAAWNFADLGDERETRMFNLDPRVGTRIGKMNGEEMLGHMKNGVDFSKLTADDRIDSKGRVHKDMNNMTPEEWKAWNKNAAASTRNWGKHYELRPDVGKYRGQIVGDFQNKEQGWKNNLKGGYNAALKRWNG
jgi:hypothetical protein